MDKLTEFYRRVKPAGPLWRPVSSMMNSERIHISDNLKLAFTGWFFANPMVLGLLIGAGNLLLGSTQKGIICLAISLVSGLITWYIIRKMSAKD